MLLETDRLFPFDDREVCARFDRQQTRYADDGFGLWSVIRKADELFIGQCGITLQSYQERTVPEIGYLLYPDYWHAGLRPKRFRMQTIRIRGARYGAHLLVYPRHQPPFAARVPAYRHAADRFDQ